MHDEKEEKQEYVLRNDDFSTEPPQWSEKEFNKMIWRTRYKMLANAVGGAIVLWLIYTIYISAIHIYFDTNEVRGKFIRSVVTAVELHGDGVRVEKPMHTVFEVTPFLSQKGTFKLYRMVGDWEVVTGEVHAKLTVTGKLSYSINPTGAYLNENSPAFVLPYSVMFDETVGGGERPESDMEQVRRIEDGFVAELSFSTDALLSPAELLDLLGEYDLRVTGMPVYAGELTEVQPGGHSIGGGGDYYVPHLTFRPMTVYEDDQRLSMWSLYFTTPDPDIEEHMERMIGDLAWATANAAYDWADVDRQRLAYIREHGMQIYGATVTGPVRELEKLGERPEFKEFRLGRVEVWNWD
ncbi:anti-sigma factor [Paenibacillus sp. JCM 10914]|uniref:anti sigma factor C-terminal domain-containing protein n=1 Tax=Paenibacillus sp. JCM 10914 TaxID=1236974 RepID=UPI0003CC6945|nr:anti sigma factor C-terminal domain-containing protein [Paenibacillus sp. JCM 10914]GAE07718.1 hypothetical protein JCM10914_3961 [Paenibacillus sp. JCM 10914]